MISESLILFQALEVRHDDDNSRGDDDDDNVQQLKSGRSLGIIYTVKHICIYEPMVRIHPRGLP